jgi:hypothetical protein
VAETGRNVLLSSHLAIQIRLDDLPFTIIIDRFSGGNKGLIWCRGLPPSKRSKPNKFVAIDLFNPSRTKDRPVSIS